MTYHTGIGFPVEPTERTGSRDPVVGAGDRAEIETKRLAVLPGSSHRDASEKYDFRNHRVDVSHVIASWMVAAGFFVLLFVLA